MDGRVGANALAKRDANDHRMLRLGQTAHADSPNTVAISDIGDWRQHKLVSAAANIADKGAAEANYRY